MRRTLAAPGLAAVLGMALLLTACGKTNAHNNTAGETVSTALFDFSITDVSLVESYPGCSLAKKMRKSCTRNENRIIYNNENLCNKTKEKEGA